MPRLRHIAIVVKDLDKEAAFYEQALGLTNLGRSESKTAHRVFLTDGAVNFALLQYKGALGSGLEDPDSFSGLHHFGFEVDDLEAEGAKVQAAGGEWYFDLGDKDDPEFERKFRDPEGVLFDISHKGWAGAKG